MINKITILNVLLTIVIFISLNISSMELQNPTQNSKISSSSNDMLPDEIKIYILKKIIKKIIYTNSIFNYLKKVKVFIKSIYISNSKFKNFVPELIKFSKKIAYKHFNIRLSNMSQNQQLELDYKLKELLISKYTTDKEIEAAKLLIIGANPNIIIQYQNEHLTPILFIIKYSKFKKLIHLLIIKNDDLSKQDKYGNDTLILSTLKGHLNIVQKLLDHKADINIQNSENNTAL